MSHAAISTTRSGTKSKLHRSVADEALLSINNVGKRFGSTTVLEDINLQVGEGEFVTILGESGSGKTTLLRIVAGFERPDSGEVRMRGERLDLLPPNRRPVNTVFQNYALFPHLSVFENVAYGLRAKKVPSAEIRSRVEAALVQMKMSGFSRRRPAELSGGQQQRVALARALVNRPAVLLLDEPLSALDASLRRHMQLELKTLQRKVGITFVFVTHDQEEAMTLSDRIVLLRRGKIAQIDTPRNIYNCPRTAYVASFIGQTNLLHARIENGRARAHTLEWPCTSIEQEAVFSLRPEHIQISKGAAPIPPGSIRLKGAVRRHIFAGASELLEVDCGGGLLLNVRTSSEASDSSEAMLEIPLEKLVPLADETGL
jgi:spermidine/putrescine transport system ATP-binding protein